MNASGAARLAPRKLGAWTPPSWTNVAGVAGDEAEVAGRFAAGDPDAIRALYQRYGGLVHATAYKVLGDSGLAEDATQQTFVQAWRAAGRFDPSRPVGPWLASIARRAAIDVYRRERRHRGVDPTDSSDAALISMPPSVDQISDVWEVRQALQELPDSDRELIRMQHFGELTHAEIASKLEIPVGTVKSRSFRAHKRLAGMLAHLRTEPTSTAMTGAPNEPTMPAHEEGGSDERR